METTDSVTATAAIPALPVGAFIMKPLTITYMLHFSVDL